MTEHQASRTLVKSAPELWAECSNAASLARHLGRFGEIRITRLEPETAVAWEGEHVSGTVRLESSGWGTRVTLTANGSRPQPPAIEAPPEPDADGAVQPPGAAMGTGPEPVAPTRPGFLARLFRFRRRPAAPSPGLSAQVDVQTERAAQAQVKTEVEPEREGVLTTDPPVTDPPAILASALESLGQAHHRPYSRA
jgi:hypothetical protein